MLTKLLNLIAKSERIEKSISPAHGNYVSVTTYTMGTTQVEVYSGIVRVIHNGIRIGYLSDRDGDAVREAIWKREEQIQEIGLKLFLAS